MSVRALYQAKIDAAAKATADTLHLGDCLEMLRGLEAGSVDAVVTDPPAGTAHGWRVEHG